jgi:hypothetical protein
MQPPGRRRNTGLAEAVMMRAWGACRVEAVDYEVIWIGHDPEREPLGRFADAHAVGAPVWRFVSGYLMLVEAAPAAARAGSRARLAVSSHGHAVATFDADEGGFSAEGTEPWRLDGEVARSDAGIALVADAGTVFTADASAHLLRGESTDAASRPVWGMTVVHGPSPTKVENRIRLLRSLERVGGRHV